MKRVLHPQNVRYCNDRPACGEASKTYSFVKLASDLTPAEYDAIMSEEE